MSKISVTRRSALALLGGAFASALVGKAQADEQFWLEASGFRSYMDRRQEGAFSLLYFGTPDKLRDVSCGDDLKFLSEQVKELRAQGFQVDPVFIFPDDQAPPDQWANIAAYVDDSGSILSAYSAPFDRVKNFARRRGWAEFTRKDGAIYTHTQYAVLVDPKGEQMMGGYANLDLVSYYRAQIEKHCAGFWAPDYCKN